MFDISNVFANFAIKLSGRFAIIHDLTFVAGDSVNDVCR